MRGALSCALPRPLAGTLACAAALCIGRPCLADSAKTFSLDYEAPPGCPSKTAFLSEIAARSAVVAPAEPGQSPDVALWARFSRGADGVHRARLTVTAGLEETNRELVAPSCAEVASALALVAALALDPLARTGGLPPLPLPPEPFVYKDVGTRPAFVLPPGAVPEVMPRGMLVGGQPELLLAPPPLPADTTFFEQREEPPVYLAAVSFAFEYGQAPTLLVGVGGHVGTERVGELPWAFRAGLGFVTSVEDAVVGPSTLAFRSLRGHFHGCLGRLELGAWLSLWPCVELSGGGHWAKVDRAIFGQVQSREEVSPWLSLGPTGRAVVELVPEFAFEVELGPDFALVRGRFQDDRGALLFDPSPAVLSGSTGVRVAF